MDDSDAKQLHQLHTCSSSTHDYPLSKWMVTVVIIKIMLCCSIAYVLDLIYFYYLFFLQSTL